MDAKIITKCAVHDLHTIGI